MSRSISTVAPVNRRKRRYVDFNIQGALSVALVLLETLMFLAAMWVLYNAYNQLIEENLYRVHRASQQDLKLAMAKVLGLTVLVMSLTNLVALAVAHALWQGYMSAVLKAFRDHLNRFQQGDFSRPVAGRDTSNGLLQHMESWRKQEHGLQNLINEHRVQLQQLMLQPPSALRSAAMAKELKALDTLLKPHSHLSD